MYCHKCGLENEDSAKYCTNCGQSFTIKNPTENIIADIAVKKANPFNSLLFWSSLLVILGFFLPWISVMGFISYNGWNISSLLLQLANAEKSFTNDATLFSILLYLIPISALVVVVMLVNQSRNAVINLFKLLPFLIILGLTSWILSKAEGKIPEEVFQVLGVGYYIVNISAILLAFAPVAKNKQRNN